MSLDLHSRRQAISRALIAACGLLMGLTSFSTGLAQESDTSSESSSSSPAPAPTTTPSSPASLTMTSGDAPAPDFSPGDGGGVGVTSTEADTVPVFEPDPEPVATGPWGVPPIKLAMPSLGVEAPIVPVGRDEDGAMSAPSDPDTVAWYEPGPGMGVPGNVVLAGHINWNNRIRAFGNLHLLEVGDPILIIDEDGRGYQYVVESSHWVRAEGAPVDEIFASTGEPVVTMITCGGEYIAATREYLDRLIVRAKGA